MPIGRPYRYYKDIPAGQYRDSDQRRYRLEIIPLHADAYDGTETDVELDDKFLESLPTWEEGGEELPWGVHGAKIGRARVNLTPTIGTPLFTYLTDGGEEVDYNLRANTLWILTTDEGFSARTTADFKPLFWGVQRHYLGTEYTTEGSDALYMDIELVDAVKVVMESIPVYSAADGTNVVSPGSWETNPATRTWFTLEEHVRERVTGMGGGSATYTALYRDHVYELLYTDSSNNVIGVYGRLYGGGNQYVFIKVDDVFTSIDSLIADLWQTLTRDSTANCSTETPFDNVTFYEQGYTHTGAEGSALLASALHWLGWIREDDGTTAWNNQAIYGGVFWGQNALGKEYANLWDMMRDFAEMCGMRGATTCNQVTGTYGSSLSLDPATRGTHSTVGWSIANEDLALSGIRPGAGAISHATGNIGDPLQETESEHKYIVDSISQSLPGYSVRFAVHNAPMTFSMEDHYWVTLPSSKVQRAKDAGAGVDVTPAGSGKAWLIATQFVNLQAFYYFGNPSFNSSGDTLALRVHHKVGVNLPGLVGTYALPEGTDIDLPEVAALSQEYPKKYYDEAITEPLRAALTEIARRSWVRYTAYLLCSIYGRTPQTAIELTFRIQSEYDAWGMLSWWPIEPQDFVSGLNTDAANYATPVKATTDLVAGTHTLTFFNREAGL